MLSETEHLGTDDFVGMPEIVQRFDLSIIRYLLTGAIVPTKALRANLTHQEKDNIKND
jgi:hypothetical protein